MKIITTTTLLVISMIFVSSCHVGRYFYWNMADVYDYQKFPAYPIGKGEGSFCFATAPSLIEPNLPATFAQNTERSDFDDFLEDSETVAFLIIRNDTILYENYFHNFSEDAIFSSFSVSKSYVSALTGIAVEEGYIKSVNQSITEFIPELLDSDPRFSEITLEHLLNMRSGIKFKEGYSTPFSDMAKYYYGTNLKKYIRKLKISQPPDQVYDYISVNSLLLGVAVERATGVSLAKYLEQKIWIPLGMEYDATWNFDSQKGKQIKAFCCINARVVDMAKFGKLYLDNGNWNGQQIVPRNWIETTMKPNSSFRDSQGYPYSYLWRVKDDGAFFAKGILGQYIYVYPEKNVIIVRMGKRDGGVHWALLFEQLCSQL